MIAIPLIRHFQKIIGFVLFLCLGAAHITALGQGNGCGTGWNSYLVPDRIVLAQCEFRSACDAHDVCYGKCGDVPVADRPSHCEYLRCKPGGDLLGNEQCRSKKFDDLFGQANRRQRMCDTRFYLDLRAGNEGKPVCRAFTTIYSRAVRWFGEGAFAGMDGRPGVGLNAEQASRSTDAIAEALSTLTPQELDALSEEISSGRSPIDWSKEVVFNRESRRLENRK